MIAVPRVLISASMTPGIVEAVRVVPKICAVVFGYIQLLLWNYG